MLKSESTRALRSRVIDFLNSPHQERKVSKFNINQELSDQQKMIILKRITAESDKYQFDLSYSLKNYQKASFLPPYSTQKRQSIIYDGRKLANISDITLPAELKEEKREQIANESTLHVKQNQHPPNTKTDESDLPKLNDFILNQNDKYQTKEFNCFDKYSIVAYQKDTSNIRKGDKAQVEENKNQGKDSTKRNQVMSPGTMYSTNNSTTPLTLTKEYKNLFRKKSSNNLNQSQSKDANNTTAESKGSTRISRGYANQNQNLFNSIKYQTIEQDEIKDPFTSSVDNFSVLRKSSIHDIKSIKVSKITPPSKIHTLVKRNNTYFFERSPSYKKEFSIPPIKNKYLRDMEFSTEDKNINIQNQFYGSQENTQIEQKELNVNDQSNETNDNIIEPGTYFKRGSYVRPSQSLSQQSNQTTFDQNSTDNKFGNSSSSKIDTSLKTPQQYKQVKQLILDEYYGKSIDEKPSYQSTLAQNKEVGTVSSPIQQERLPLNSTKSKKNELNLISEIPSTEKQIPLSPTKSKKLISSQLISNINPADNEMMEVRASFNINNSKLFSLQFDDQITTINSQSPSKRLINTLQQDQVLGADREGISLKDIGQFKMTNAKKQELGYDRFKYNIGEYEKNIQSLLMTQQYHNPSFLKRKKKQLPKAMIVSSQNRTVKENPAPGYYNLNESSFSLNRGFTFSQEKKVSSLEAQPQYSEKYKYISKQKLQPLQEETAEQYFSKLMGEIKREVEKERRQIGQVYLKADSTQELNSIEQSVVDRYQQDLIQKMIECKRHIYNIKQHLKREDPFFKKV